MQNAVHFGAGNIGRGFVALLLTKSDFHVTFLDVNDKVIQALKHRGEYTVGLVGETMSVEKVTNVTGINSAKDPDAVFHALLDADLITTAVGPSILPIIAKQLVPAMIARCANDVQRYLNIIACENTIGGSHQLETALRALLDDKTNAYLSQWVGFPNAAVDRIVPNQVNEDPLHVNVEPFYEWVVDRDEVKGGLLIEGVHFTDRLDAFIERKLFTVNTGHASCAYAAYLKHIETIPEAMKDSEIVTFVESVIRETGQLIVSKYGFSMVEQEAYIQKTLKRFANPYIVDEVVRVARSPMRKLSSQDRFVKPVVELINLGLSADSLLRSMANALRYDYEGDAEAVQIQTMIREHGVADTVSRLTGWPIDHILVEKLADIYNSISN